MAGFTVYNGSWEERIHQMDQDHQQGEDAQTNKSVNLEIPDSPQPATCHHFDESSPSINQTELLKALEVVEKDSLAIAGSFTSLFASLRLALSEVTGSSVDHMRCFGDAAGRLQESVLDAATKGNRYINSCLRLNQEMKGIDAMASQLKMLRRNADALDTAVNKILRVP